MIDIVSHHDFKQHANIVNETDNSYAMQKSWKIMEQYGVAEAAAQQAQLLAERDIWAAQQMHPIQDERTSSSEVSTYR